MDNANLSDTWHPKFDVVQTIMAINHHTTNFARKLTMSQSAGQKRKYLSHPSQKNPKRGGPGVFLTCETGRERKCRVEALDILNHYVREDTTTPDDPTNDDGKPLSLDDEINQLKSKRGKKQIFSAYNTGVRGTITLLCTLPDCNIIPQFRTSDMKREHGAEAEDGNDDEPESKKLKTEEEKEEPTKPEETVEAKAASPQSPPSWDPIVTVKQVLKDLREGSATAPSSPSLE